MPRQFTTPHAFTAMLLVAAVVSSCARPATAVAVPEPLAAATADSTRAAAAAPAPRKAPLPEPGSAVACTSSGFTLFNADSVALRFVGAFLNVRVLPIRLSLPSSGAVDAGPVDVTTPAAARISARTTTESGEDGTAYLVEVRVAPPVQGWTAADSGIARNHAASLCDRLKALALP